MAKKTNRRNIPLALIERDNPSLKQKLFCKNCLRSCNCDKKNQTGVVNCFLHFDVSSGSKWKDAVII